ncbi:MAG: hypothetical protein ACHQNA_13285 [Acidimicrobiales bacterium]
MVVDVMPEVVVVGQGAGAAASGTSPAADTCVVAVVGPVVVGPVGPGWPPRLRLALLEEGTDVSPAGPGAGSKPIWSGEMGMLKESLAFLNTSPSGTGTSLTTTP